MKQKSEWEKEFDEKFEVVTSRFNETQVAWLKKPLPFEIKKFIRSLLSRKRTEWQEEARREERERVRKIVEHNTDELGFISHVTLTDDIVIEYASPRRKKEKKT